VAFCWVQLPLEQFGTLVPEVRFCAESGKASKQTKPNSILACITASIWLDDVLEFVVSAKLRQTGREVITRHARATRDRLLVRLDKYFLSHGSVMIDLIGRSRI
jgi:hypothetical protein